jgi:hypothetical protein
MHLDTEKGYRVSYIWLKAKHPCKSHAYAVIKTRGIQKHTFGLLRVTP